MPGGRGELTLRAKGFFRPRAFPGKGFFRARAFIGRGLFPGEGFYRLFMLGGDLKEGIKKIHIFQKLKKTIWLAKQKGRTAAIRHSYVRCP
jgi:hypothetical protein